ncbi:MAG: nucleotidyltransferase family protein [Pseudomonadota bacterium]
MRRLTVGHARLGRALVGLVTATLTGRLPPQALKDLRAAAPVSLSLSAQFNQVQTAIAPGLSSQSDLAKVLPDDLRLFFDAMYEANADRLSLGMGQLKELNRTLAAEGIDVVMLKGAADMLDPLHARPSIRFIADLDILVPEDAVQRAVEALASIGAHMPTPAIGRTSSRDLDGRPVSRHHIPAIVRTDWGFPVELHFRMGGIETERVLPSQRVRSGARRLHDIRLFIPNDLDRSLHLILHASYHRGEPLLLRAAMDWTALRRRVAREEIAEEMARHGAAAAYRGLDRLSDLLDGDEAAWDECNVFGPLFRQLAIIGSSRPRRLTYPGLRNALKKARAYLFSPEFRRRNWSKRSGG